MGQLWQVGSGVRVRAKYAVIVVDDPAKGEDCTSEICVILHSSWPWASYVQAGVLEDSVKQVFFEFGERPSRTVDGRAIDVLLLAWDEEMLREEDGFQVIRLAPEHQGKLAFQYKAASTQERPGLATKIVQYWLQENGIAPEGIQYTTGVIYK